MFALMTAATATAQTQVMNIYKTDGTKLTYKVADVQQVLFEEVAHVSSNTFTVTDTQGAQHIGTINSLFHNAAVNEYGDQSFTFGDVASASTVDDLKQGTYAVQLTLAAELVNTTVDLTEHPSPETEFKLVDYANTKVYTSPTAGKVTTEVADDGMVYLKLEGVTFEDGTTVDGDYYAAATQVTETGDINPTLTLNNQYAYNYDVTDIKSVVVCETTGDNAGYTVAFYATEGVTDFSSAEPLLSLFVSSSYVGQTIDLSSETEEPAAMIQDANWTFMQTVGSLTLSFDRLGANIAVSLDVKEGSSWAGDQRVRIEYSGAFETTYQTSDELVITSADSSVLLDQAITSVLRQQPAETGGATFFGLGDANASTAEGYLEGKYGVLFSVSAAKLGSTVDLATETDSYTFKLIDYTAGTVDEAVASGTITTIEKDGKVYIALNATMTSGVTVAFDYFAAVTDVDDITPMIPVSKLSNAYEYYDSDGNISDTQTITTVQYKTSGGGYTTFYLMPDGASYNAYSTTTPQLQVKTEWITSTPTTYDLGALQAEDYFRFRFKGMDLCSPDSKYYGYSNTPNNGTLTISQDADGNYDIYLEISNSYSNSYTTSGGDNTKVVLAYTGAATSR